MDLIVLKAASMFNFNYLHTKSKFKYMWEEVGR